jgi:TolB protein
VRSILISILAAIFPICSLFAEAKVSSRRLCFTRAESAWIANLDGTAPRRLVTGADAVISPEGTRVAYTELGKGGERHIAVIDIETEVKTVFQNLPSDNAYGPIWSPDGKQLLLRIYFKNHWRLGSIREAGTGFQFIGGLSPTNTDYYSAVWAPDGQSLYCQDLSNIYQIDLSGTVSSQWKIGDLVPDGDLDSGSQIDPAADGLRFLLDASLNKEGPIKDWDGPPSAIFLVEIASAKSKRLTPPIPYAWEPCWISDQDFLFTGAVDARHRSIYKASISGGKPQILIKNAEHPSVGGS